MSLPWVYTTLSDHRGYCARCGDDSPLVVGEYGPRGFRAWLAGIGAQDRDLYYACLACGLTEHVPLTEAEDEEYAATFASWPDWSPAEQPVTVDLETDEVAFEDLHVLTAIPGAPAPPRPVVRVVTLPVQRLTPTDDRLLAFDVA